MNATITFTAAPAAKANFTASEMKFLRAANFDITRREHGTRNQHASLNSLGRVLLVKIAPKTGDIAYHVRSTFADERRAFDNFEEAYAWALCLHWHRVGQLAQ
jgi:hypothetical protein